MDKDLKHMEKLLKSTGLRESAVQKSVKLKSGCLSSTEKVYLKNSSVDGKSVMSVIVKQPGQGHLRRLAEEANLFQVESKMYLNVLTKIESIFMKANREDLIVWPHLYGHREWDAIVIEDLNDKGFFNLKQRALNLEQTFTVVKAIARIHAASFFLINNGILDTSDFNRYLFATPSTLEEVHKTRLRTLSEFIDPVWGNGWDRMKYVLKDLVGRHHNKLKVISGVKEGDFNVINHGDIWASNILIDNRQNIRLIDFQLSYYGSFAIDLNFILYNAVELSVLTECKDEVLKVYHQALHETYKVIGQPVSSLPSLGSLKEELERTAYTGMSIYLCTYDIFMNLNNSDTDLTADFKDQECYLKDYLSKDIVKEDVKKRLAIMKDTKHFWDDTAK